MLLVISTITFKYIFAGGWCHSTNRIDGKVVIVTGANTGIGKETVADLVKRGGKVYMACRSLERCNNAASDIRERTSANDSNLFVLELDLASLKSVRQFATEFSSREKKLDILINNAGVMAIPKHTPTEEGFEMHVGVNHLGHFLLTHLLMDQLFAAKPSRVVTVASEAYKIATIDLRDLLLEKEGAYNMHGLRAYAFSKTANMLFSQELGKRLKGFGVNTYSLHPGTIDTELVRYSFLGFPYVNKVTSFLSRPFLKTPVEGAQTQICCAVDEKLADETGKYYRDCQEEEPLKYARLDENAKKLWDISVDLVKLQQDEIHPLLR